MIVAYRLFYKKQGVTLRDRGIIISREVAWKTLLLSVLVVSCAFGIVFFAHYFFLTDFRIWVLAVKAFNADKVLIALRYVPFFLIYFIINSIAVNCFNYNSIGGKKDWLNITILAVFNSLGPIVLVILQYTTFFATGLPLFSATEGDKIGPIWLIPVIIILTISAVISRIIYKKTKNPYLAGLINAMITTMILCSNTVTILGVTLFRQ